MKIAIYHNLPSGGAKRALFETARRLAARHDLHVYSLSTADHVFGDVRGIAASHRIWRFQPLPLLRSPLGRLNQAIRWVDLQRLRFVTRGIARQMVRDGFDLAYVHPCQFENGPSLLRELRHAPSVYFCQEPLRRFYESMPARPYDRPTARRRRLLDRIDPLPGLYQRALQRSDRASLRSADLVLVNSEFIRSAVAAIYQVEARVSYLGVDVEGFRPVSAEKHDSLLSVGSLTPLKGFDFLIRSLAHLPPEARPRLRITSNFEIDQERQYLLGLARQLGVAVDLLGAVSDAELVALYNQASLTVYAPVREPFGLVALESLACGTPVVGVREGGLAETIVHGEVGLLVDRDERAFAEAIDSLMKSPSLRDRFARNGRQMVLQHWSWDGAAARLDASLAEGLRRHGLRGAHSARPASAATPSSTPAGDR
jgi:glycosyltransferase involved in cell wall biosynthesis